MTLSKTFKRLITGGAVVAVLALAVSVALPAVASAHGGPGGFGRGAIAAPVGPGGNEYLADALGISVEDLQAAHEQANEAALAQAVEQGLLTQEQADAIQEREGRFGGFGDMIGRFHLRFGTDAIDMDALLADALGISVDDLQAARAAASDAALAQAVEDGKITQEQADQMQARRSLQDYLNGTDLRDRMRSLLEDAVQQAVEAGVISQEQADAFLQRQGDFGFGMRGFDGHFGGRGFPGMRGHGHGGMRGFGGPGMFGPNSGSSSDNTGTAPTAFRL